MKHTLKSLLIASVLTLPTVWGGADELHHGTTDPTTDARAVAVQPSATSTTCAPGARTFDQTMLELFGVPSTPKTFDEWLTILFQNQNSSLSSDQRLTISNTLKQQDGLNDDQKRLLTIVIRTDATPMNILWAADRLKALEFIDKAAELYDRIGKHADATLTFILLAADELNAFKFIDKAIVKAADFYERAGNHKDADPHMIRLAANELKALGFKDRADALLKKHGL